MRPTSDSTIKWMIFVKKRAQFREDESLLQSLYPRCLRKEYRLALYTKHHFFLVKICSFEDLLLLMMVHTRSAIQFD